MALNFPAPARDSELGFSAVQEAAQGIQTDSPATHSGWSFWHLKPNWKIEEFPEPEVKDHLIPLGVRSPISGQEVREGVGFP